MRVIYAVVKTIFGLDIVTQSDGVIGGTSHKLNNFSEIIF